MEEVHVVEALDDSEDDFLELSDPSWEPTVMMMDVAASLAARHAVQRWHLRFAKKRKHGSLAPAVSCEKQKMPGKNGPAASNPLLAQTTSVILK